MTIITEEEQKAVAAIKAQINSLHVDAQKVLMYGVSWAERNFWPWMLGVSIVSFLVGLVL
jgi:hypothetical protein